MNFVKNVCVVLTTNMAALSRGCSPRMEHRKTAKKRALLSKKNGVLRSRNVKELEALCNYY